MASRVITSFSGIVLGLALALPAAAGVLEPVNQLGIGTLSGQVQLLAMHRHYLEQRPLPETDAASGTLALTLGYDSPPIGPLSVGVQGIACLLLFEGGSDSNPKGQAWKVFNKDFTTLQHAFLKTDLSRVGLAGSRLTVGRQPLSVDFFQPYAIRQKAQAIQGATLELGVIPKVPVTMGYFTHFSSWSPQDETIKYSVQFKEVGPVAETFLEIPDSLQFDSNGAMFLSADMGLVPGASITAYGFLLSDLYNTFGIKAAHAFTVGGALTLTPKAHVIKQNDAGKLSELTTVDATAVDLAVQAKFGATALEPGLIMLSGDKGENSLNVPFRTSLTADPLLLWYARMFNGGAQTLYIRGTTAFGRLKVYLLLARTSHKDWVSGGATDSEIDVVLSYTVLKPLTAAIKAGYGDQDNVSAPDKSASDLRLFLTWKL